GQLDEVRIWNVARTEEQIRETMSRKLTGQEPGLVGLWNFDDPANPGRDSSPGRHDGQLMGNAAVVRVQWPRPAPTTPLQKVLSLDGNDSFVELPPNIFNNLEEATVEAWVKWGHFRRWSRVFDFGEGGTSMATYNCETGPDLQFEVSRNKDEAMGYIKVPSVCSTNNWIHMPSVACHAGMRLYVNGLLVGTNSHTGSYAGIGNGRDNYLGRDNWRDARPEAQGDFEGQMAEVRVWNVARTEEQIRE